MVECVYTWNLIVTLSPDVPIFTVSRTTGLMKLVWLLPALRTTQKSCLERPWSVTVNSLTEDRRTPCKWINQGYLKRSAWNHPSQIDGTWRHHERGDDLVRHSYGVNRWLHERPWHRQRTRIEYRARLLPARTSIRRVLLYLQDANRFCGIHVVLR